MSLSNTTTPSTAGLVPAVTPAGNQNAPLDPFDFTESTLSERTEFITNSVGVVLTKYEDEKEESKRIIENLERKIERDKDMHLQIQDKMNKEISDHKQDIALAEAATQKKTNELDDAEKKYTKLEQEATGYKMDTETQLITKQEDIERLKGEIVVCKLGLAFAKEGISDKDTANKNLRTQHESLRQEITDQIKLLEQVVEQEKAYKENAINEKNVSDGKYNKLVQEAAECSTKTNTQLTTMRANIGQLEGTIVSLEEESVIKATAYEGLMVRYEERERDVKQAEADNMKAIQERDVFEKTCIKLGREAVVCSTNLRFAQQDVSDKNIDIQKLQTDNGNLRNDNANIRGEITVAMNAHADKKKLTTENAELRDKLKSEEKNYNKDIASHKKELAKKDAELATGNEELASKNEELARLQAKVEQLGLEKEELKEVKQEQIEQMYDHWNDRERDEHQGFLELLKEERARKQEELARQQQELARTEEKIARREETPTPPILLDGRKVPAKREVIIIMDPTIALPEKCINTCCRNRKWCDSVDAECNTAVFKFGCPADCRSKGLGDERAFRKHVMGNTKHNGCRLYAKKYPGYIASYTRVWDDTPKQGGKYRPTFVFADHKTNDGLTQKQLDTREKKWQKELQKHEEQDSY